MLTSQQYDAFYSFYKNLLDEFEEMEIELQIDEHVENEDYCFIMSMYGSYSEKTSFTLLDSSEIDFSKEELKLMLTNYFRIDSHLADQVLDIKK